VQFNASAISYTFSGPRAGDSAFAQAFGGANLQTWRIFNTEDLVPTVPPAAVVMVQPNMGMQSTSPITHVLPLFIKMFPAGYEHIGYPIAITFHRDTIADNHNLTTTYQAL